MKVAIKKRPAVDPAPEIPEGNKWHVAKIGARRILRRDGKGRIGELQLEKELADAGFITYRPAYCARIIRKRAQLGEGGKPGSGRRGPRAFPRLPAGRFRSEGKGPTRRSEMGTTPRH